MLKTTRVFLLEEKFSKSKLANFSQTTKAEVNGVEEELKTTIFVNENILDSYIHCRVVMDEIFDINGRAFNRNLAHVIVQSSYDVYVGSESGVLITLCNKKSSDRIKDIFQEMLGMTYVNYSFDLNTIVFDSSNVKKASFTNLTIQTLSSGIIKENKVNDTEIFEDMIQNGELTNIIVAYPFGMQDINISVSSSGSLILYTNLADEECIQFIHQLMN